MSTTSLQARTQTKLFCMRALNFVSSFILCHAFDRFADCLLHGCIPYQWAPSSPTLDYPVVSLLPAHIQTVWEAIEFMGKVWQRWCLLRKFLPVRGKVVPIWHGSATNRPAKTMAESPRPAKPWLSRQSTAHCMRRNYYCKSTTMRQTRAKQVPQQTKMCQFLVWSTFHRPRCVRFKL